MRSYTMLTINADGHSLMQQFQKLTAEKRMVVVLSPNRHRDWLEARTKHSMAFMRPIAAIRWWRLFITSGNA